MKKKIKRRWIVLSGLIIIVFLIWLNNTNLFSNKEKDYKLLAHRGLAQTFDISNVKWDTNTAKIIYEPEHEYLENTIASMEAAFGYGADVVELDILKTKDNQLAVFHDYDLSFRTEATGSAKDFTMEELKQLDIGYWYTADNGKTYPFRGKGIGLMPELKEVLEIFPDKDLLIHMKSGDIDTAKILWSYLKSMSEERLDQITVYGSDDCITYLRNQKETLRLLSIDRLKKSLLKYELIGFTGYIPKEIHNMELHIPLKYAKFLWGWPNKFIRRMESVNTRVVIVEGDGTWSEGFDSVDSLDKVPEGFSGYVWTNRIDRISEQKE